MSERPRGRPVTFDRDRAVLEAARLFWRYGYSGTSTRALTAALGVSTSSLYAAFGSKAGLFELAVRRYAGRYHRIYRDAVREQRIHAVVGRILTESVAEFTPEPANHPGCLAGSAALVDSPETLDAAAYVSRLQRSDADLLLSRLEQAAGERELAPGVDPARLAALVQTLWHGLSARAVEGAERTELLDTVGLALDVLESLLCVPATASCSLAPEATGRG